MTDTFPWEKPGLARSIYDKYLQQEPLIEQFVRQIRLSWGGVTKDDLASSPDIRSESFHFMHNNHMLQGYNYSDPKQACKGHFLYLHGGGWMAPTGGRHVRWAKKMAGLTGFKFWALEYSLAPEKPYPHALQEIIALLDYLNHHVDSSEQIVIGGDSSGANLSAAAVLYSQQHALPLPSKVLLMCGLFDLNFESYDSMQNWAPYHPHQSLGLLALQRACYIPDSHQWQHATVSPINGNLVGFPKTLMIIAEEDVLVDDNVRFANKLIDAGVDVSKHVFEKMPHTFYFHPEEVNSQATEAITIMCNFLN